MYGVKYVGYRRGLVVEWCIVCVVYMRAVKL